MDARRYALIGAHLGGEAINDVAGVTTFDLPPITISAIDLEPSRSLADPEILKRALEVRQQLLARDTFIAIRYGVSAATVEEIRQKCGPHLRRWQEILEKRRGLVEITLRIPPQQKISRPDRRDFRTGADYLRALHRSRSSQLSEDLKHRIETAFRSLAVEHRWVSREDGGTEFAALIRRDHLDNVRQAATDLQPQLSEVPFLLSGPWPLEIFADEG